MKSTQTNPETMTSGGSMLNTYRNGTRSRSNSRNAFHTQPSNGVNHTFVNTFLSNQSNAKNENNGKYPDLMDPSENDNFYINVGKKKQFSTNYINTSKPQRNNQNNISSTATSFKVPNTKYRNKEKDPYSHYTYGGDRPRSSIQTKLVNRYKGNSTNKPINTNPYKSPYRNVPSKINSLNKRESALFKLKRLDSGKVDLKSLDLGRKRNMSPKNSSYGPGYVNRSSRFNAKPSKVKMIKKII
jgi:hypothetical protein